MNHIDYEELVLFAFDTAHEIAGFAQGQFWSEEACSVWRNEGFDMLKSMMLEDLTSTQLNIRKSCVLATKRELFGRMEAYSRIRGKHNEEKQLDSARELMNRKNFKAFCLAREKVLLKAMDDIPAFISDRKMTP